MGHLTEDLLRECRNALKARFIGSNIQATQLPDEYLINQAVRDIYEILEKERAKDGQAK